MSDEFARFYDEVYKHDNPATESHGWIQWKGTNACIDLHCQCGEESHLDGFFLYYYRCKGCNRVYALGQNVKLIELTAEQRGYLERSSPDMITEGSDE